MDTFEKKVKAILAEYFDSNEILFEKNPDGRVSGFIISEKFSDMDDFARQTKIWSLLRKKLRKAEQKKVIGFLAYTPAEHHAYSQPIL